RPRLAVDAAAPAGSGGLDARRIDPGAERCEAERALDLGGYRPRAVALIIRDIVKGGAAQAASGRQKRDCLDAIGLAGAVRADQRDHGTARLKARRAIIAEMREDKAVGGGGGHGERGTLQRRRRRRDGLPQLLTSSSAKADEPVFRAAQGFMRDNDYWTP